MYSRWCVLALVWGASGCGAFMNQAASSQLQTGYDLAQQRAAVAEADVQKLTGRLERLERMLRDQGIDGSSSGASLTSVTGEISQIRGSVEELSFAIKALREEFDGYQVGQERRQLQDEARLDQLERLLGVAPPAAGRVDGTTGGGRAQGGGTTEPAPAPPTPVAPAEEAPKDTAARLALAEERMTQGLQPAARIILQQAIAEAPAGDSLLPEAQYRLAETWFNEGKFKDAARAFQVVTDKYAKSSWASWSMLRIGECFSGLGRPQDAKYFFEGVVTKYPGSDAALEARAKLEP
jgi:TolA-binding protein